MDCVGVSELTGHYILNKVILNRTRLFVIRVMLESIEESISFCYKEEENEEFYFRPNNMRITVF